MPLSRAEIVQEYLVANGRIRSPGRYQNEPVYAPYFLSLALEGFADEDDGQTYRFNVDASDVQHFPELEGVTVVCVWLDDLGFARTRATVVQA